MGKAWPSSGCRVFRPSSPAKRRAASAATSTAPPRRRRGIGCCRWPPSGRPNAIEPLGDVPDLPDFTRDVQPILDRNCVRCHDYDRREGGVILSGDHGPMFSHSYYTLTVWGQLADGRNQAQSNYAAADAGQRRGAVDEVAFRRALRREADGTRAPPRTALARHRGPLSGTYAALGTGSIGGYIDNAATLNNDSDWPETRGPAGFRPSLCGMPRPAEQPDCADAFR